MFSTFSLCFLPQNITLIIQALIDILLSKYTLNHNPKCSRFKAKRIVAVSYHNLGTSFKLLKLQYFSCVEGKLSMQNIFLIFLGKFDVISLLEKINIQIPCFLATLLLLLLQLFDFIIKITESNLLLIHSLNCQTCHVNISRKKEHKVRCQFI